MTVRPIAPGDGDAIVALYERVMRPGRPPSPAVREWFERVVFAGIWADAEIPSLVAIDGDGRVEGFLGSHVRRLLVDGSPKRLAVSGQLVADPDARGLAPGARLLRTYLDGPQDLTITDGATATVRAIWERMGGELAHPQSIEWWRSFRPGSLALALREQRRGRGRPSRGATAAGRAGDAAARLFPANWLGRLASVGDADMAAPPEVTDVEPLDPAGMSAALPEVTKGLGLSPDYDERFLAWLLGELELARDDTLRARLVRGADGRALGWFVYYLVPGGIAPVISVAAPDEASSGAVMDALVDDARSGGAAAVRGRLEPRLVAPAAARGSLFRYAGQALVHGRDPALVALATSRHALLTRLEGEWWMSPHLL